MRLCPYCKQAAGGVGGGDEFLDYCGECEMIIEGNTLEVEETILEVAEAAADYIHNIEMGHVTPNQDRVNQSLVDLHASVLLYEEWRNDA